MLTSFIGRQREIAEISQLLASVHLVSLVGAGGCGKTRLALRVAELTDQHIQSVCWVELARLDRLDAGSPGRRQSPERGRTVRNALDGHAVRFAL